MVALELLHDLHDMLARKVAIQLYNVLMSVSENTTA